MYKRALPFLICVPVLCACQALTGPSFMPTGYAYHSEVYKAQPGPEAPGIGYDYTAQENENALQGWRFVAGDLIDQLESQTGLGPQEIYLKPLPYANAFNQSFDYALRSELLARGYVLATSGRDDMLMLQYEAFLPEDRGVVKQPVYNGDQEKVQMPLKPEQPTGFVMTLSGWVHGAELVRLEGLYDIPAYGYETGAGRPAAMSPFERGNP